MQYFVEGIRANGTRANCICLGLKHFNCHSSRNFPPPNPLHTPPTIHHYSKVVHSMDLGLDCWV